MSTNRLSWVGVGVVVLVVAGLVVRTLRHDATTQSGSAARSETAAPRSADANGAAPSKEARTAAVGEHVMSSVQRAKVVLKAKGFYDGAIDSNFDPPMIEALKKFQASAGMRATGYLDMPTYKALGIEVKNPRP